MFSIILNEKWAIQSLAAMKIQQVYRNWRIWRRYYLNKINCNRKGSSRSQMFSRTLQPLNICFECVISRKAHIEQKMVVWRAVLDLRRLHSKLSVDILIKALIEAEGEFNRANILLGSKEFRSKNAAELPVIVRNLFLPLSSSPIDNSTTMGRKNTESLKCGSASSSGRMKLLRALREQQRIIKRDELVHAVDYIVSSSYFSASIHNSS